MAKPGQKIEFRSLSTVTMNGIIWSKGPKPSSWWVSVEHSDRKRYHLVVPSKDEAGKHIWIEVVHDETVKGRRTKA